MCDACEEDGLEPDECGGCEAMLYPCEVSDHVCSSEEEVAV